MLERLVLATVLAALPGDFAAPPPPAIAWPEGPGKVLVQTRCLACHQGELIVSQRLTPAQWQRVVDKMVGWGAPLDEAERAELTAYLARHWPPERAIERPAVMRLRPLK